MTVHLRDFDVETPETLAEAVALLGDSPGDTMIVGGGTDLVPKMKRRQAGPARLVSLAGISEMHGIRTDADGTCSIGASTTLANVALSPLVPEVLAHAASRVASPQIRNVATVGGNLCLDTRCNYIDQPETWRQASGYCLKDGGETCWVAPRGDRCWAINSTDLAPVTVALGASVRIAGPRGERTIAAENLYLDEGIDRLTMGPDEILVELILPPGAGRSSYVKLARRGAIDFPLLGVATSVEVDAEGVCTSVRIVVGGISSAPVRAVEAERRLMGEVFTSEAIEDAARLGAHPLRPMDNTDTGSRYRKWMTSVYIAKSLEHCLQKEQP